MLTVYVVGRKHLQGKTEAGAVPGCPLASWTLPVQGLSSTQDEDMEINRGEMLQFPLPRALKPECVPLQLCGLCAKRCILTLVFYVIQGFKNQQGKIMLSFLLICAVYFFCCFGILSA